ncbi:MAG TPA: curli production assembly protein CsgG, partial [Sulfurimonas sp.]|nr:curli production assembly protein CsgG [Sulfurimonas sp.]
MKVKFIVLRTLSLMILVGCASSPKQNTVHDTRTNIPVISKTLAQAVDTKSIKRKVAIGRFTNETAYGQSFFIDKNNNRIGKQAMDILSAKLFQTGKFIMLERTDIAQIQKELDIDGAGKVRNSADYIIVGSITEFGRKQVSDVGIFSRNKKQVANAKVHIRVIDVSTGQIIYSEEGKGEAFSEAASTFGVGVKAGYDSSLNDKVLDAAITNLASNIIENMLDKPWKSYILGYEDGNIIISGGKSQNIKVGSEFDVLKEGKKIKNPQTNMMITLPGKKLASIKVLMSVGDTPESEV